MEGGSDHPAVTTVVARPSCDDDASAELVGKSPDDLGGRAGAGALHQRARGDARCDRRRVGGPSARGVDDVHVGYFCDAPTVRP
jgi:hypothetical protein